MTEPRRFTDDEVRALAARYAQRLADEHEGKPMPWPTDADGQNACLRWMAAGWATGHRRGLAEGRKEGQKSVMYWMVALFAAIIGALGGGAIQLAQRGQWASFAVISTLGVGAVVCMVAMLRGRRL